MGPARGTVPRTPRGRQPRALPPSAAGDPAATAATPARESTHPPPEPRPARKLAAAVVPLAAALAEAPARQRGPALAASVAGASAAGSLPWSSRRRCCWKRLCTTSTRAMTRRMSRWRRSGASRRCTGTTPPTGAATVPLPPPLREAPPRPATRCHFRRLPGRRIPRSCARSGQSGRRGARQPAPHPQPPPASPAARAERGTKTRIARHRAAQTAGRSAAAAAPKRRAAAREGPSGGGGARGRPTATR
mmetsp:Transcript_38286/g.120615  ORF Transcript_38286/g.120615 Transcript_38286/m.120615 type:complete len:248 (-) Transcript_38286:1750-2493(-)